MKIKVLIDCTTRAALHAGQVIDLPENTVNTLIRLGFAEPFKEEVAAEEAAAEDPAVEEAAAEEVAAEDPVEEKPVKKRKNKG